MIRKNFFVNKWSVLAFKCGLVLAMAAPLASCSGDDDDDLVGNWVQLSQFEGTKRTDAVGTAVDNIGYIGMGMNESVSKNRYTDFWKYDADANQWNQVASFPASGRTGAVAFEADGKLYVGTGYDDSRVFNNDFYVYDPSNNTWDAIAPLPGVGRRGAVAFSINGIGYVGMGQDADLSSLKDFYAYNPSTMAWEQVNSYGGNKSVNGVAFVINNEGYVCTGYDNQYNNDFYKYVPGDNKWVQLAKISDATSESFDDDYDVVRINAVAFTSGGKGYVATGGKGSAGSDTWEYDPTTDRWTEKTAFEGSSRYNAVAFTLKDKGYVVTGQNSSLAFDDIWMFEPYAEYDKYD